MDFKVHAHTYVRVHRCMRGRSQTQAPPLIVCTRTHALSQRPASRRIVCGTPVHPTCKCPMARTSSRVCGHTRTLTTRASWTLSTPTLASVQVGAAPCVWLECSASVAGYGVWALSRISDSCATIVDTPGGPPLPAPPLPVKFLSNRPPLPLGAAAARQIARSEPFSRNAREPHERACEPSRARSEAWAMHERSRAVPEERERERPCFWQCEGRACNRAKLDRLEGASTPMRLKHASASNKLCPPRIDAASCQGACQRCWSRRGTMIRSFRQRLWPSRRPFSFPPHPVPWLDFRRLHEVFHTAGAQLVRRSGFESLCWHQALMSFKFKPQSWGQCWGRARLLSHLAAPFKPTTQFP